MEINFIYTFYGQLLLNVETLIQNKHNYDIIENAWMFFVYHNEFMKISFVCVRELNSLLVM